MEEQCATGCWFDRLGWTRTKMEEEEGDDYLLYTIKIFRNDAYVPPT